MRRIIGAFALLITLLACSGDDDQATTAATTLPGGLPPEPDQPTADAYIAALDAIDPRIDRDDPESAIDRGRDECSTIKAFPADRARQIETTIQRFTSPEVPNGWPPEIAEQILDVVHQHLCPTY